MLFWWGRSSFRLPIYNINSTSSPTLMYSNLFLFTTDSFHSLIYNINVTFSPTITYFNLFHFTTASLHFLIYNLSITFSPKLTYSKIFLFTTTCFNPFWCFSLKKWIGGVICCSTSLGCLIHKTGFFGEGLDVPSFLLFFDFFFLCSVYNFLLHYASSIDLSW